MKVPAQVVFKNMTPSNFANLLVDEELDKLSEYKVHITHCRVSIERVESNEFRTYKVQGFLNLPGNEILVEVDTSKFVECKSLGTAIHEVFFQIRHRLMKQKDTQVKKVHRAPGLKRIASEYEPQAVS